MLSNIRNNCSLTLIILISVCLVFGGLGLRPSFGGSTRTDYQKVAAALLQDTREEYLNKKQVLQMLQNGQYRALSRKLALWHRQYLNDRKSEFTIIQSFQSFETKDIAHQVYFNQWIKQNPESYIAYSARGQYYYGLAWKTRGHEFIQDTPKENIKKSRILFASAKKDFQKALELNPNLLPAHYGLLATLMNGAPYKEMKVAWKKALLTNRKSYYLHRRFIISLEPRWGGSHKRMVAYANMVRKRYVENPRNALLAGFVYSDMASIYSRKKNYKKAVELYDKALEYGPFSGWFSSRANMYSKQKKYKEAVKDYTSAIYYLPRSSGYHRWRGKVYMKIKQYDLAKNDFIRATELNEKSVNAWNYLGWVYEETDKRADAVAAFSETLKLNPDNAYALRKTGRYYLYYEKNPKKAVGYFERLIKIEPEEANSWYYHGDVLHDLKDPRHKASFNRYLKLMEKQGKTESEHYKKVRAHIRGS